MLGKTYEKIDFIKAKEYYALAMRGNAELSGAVYYNDQPPEMLYYQALAADALGKTKQSRGMFNKLISYGLEHMEDNAEADYFAVSLPDFLVFEPDLNRKNRVSCSYLAALGYYGIGDKEKAQELTDKGLSENISHQGLLELKKQLKGN